jgi:GST-like protein
LEELLAAGIADADYDAWLVNIGEGDQFSSGFVDINPNSKIPAMVDTSTTPETKLFESGSILRYLADKFNVFIPNDPAAKVECFNWLFWQVGSAPYLGGGFGHFYSYAPYPMEYPINRFTMEVKRELDVLDKHLAKNTYFAGEEYSIADMAIWPWYGNLVLGNLYDAATFLQVNDYKHVLRWATEVGARPAVQRGVIVNRTWGDAQLKDRHSAKDIDDALNEAK